MDTVPNRLAAKLPELTSPRSARGTLPHAVGFHYAVGAGEFQPPRVALRSPTPDERGWGSFIAPAASLRGDRSL